MANKREALPNQGGWKWTLNTSAVVECGNAHHAVVSKWRLHVKTGGALPGSFIPKIRATGSGLTGSDLISPVYYKDSDTATITGGTAVTTNDVYEIVTDGCDLYLDYTSDSDGMIVYCKPVIG